MTEEKNEIPDTSEVANSETIERDKVVTFHYRLREVDDSGSPTEWMEESFGKDPLSYLHGYQNVVLGLEQALEGKTVGDTVEITLSAEEGYGKRDPKALFRVPLKHLRLPAGVKRPRPGLFAAVETNKGARRALILKVGKFNADVDLNHPLAGRTLYYEVEVVGMRDATEEEKAHRHVHGPGGHHH